MKNLLIFMKFFEKNAAVIAYILLSGIFFVSFNSIDINIVFKYFIGIVFFIMDVLLLSGLYINLSKMLRGFITKEDAAKEYNKLLNSYDVNSIIKSLDGNVNESELSKIKELLFKLSEVKNNTLD